jgi:hypothetical protein
MNELTKKVPNISEKLLTLSIYLSIYLFVRPFIYGSTVLLVELSRFSVSCSYTPWMEDQPVSKPLPTHKENKHRINAHWYPCLEQDSTHDFSVRASEESSCLRPRSHRDRQWLALLFFFFNLEVQVLTWDRGSTTSSFSILSNLRFTHAALCSAVKHDSINSLFHTTILSFDTVQLVNLKKKGR